MLASGEIISVLNEELLVLNMGRSALRVCVFAAGITGEFILGLHVLHACDGRWAWGASCYD
jgi:hypothetical protein